MKDSRATLTNIYSQHPAKTEDFSVIHRELMSRVNRGLINIVVDQDLELFTYSMDCRHNKQWDRYTLMARGLVLCPTQNKVVATPLLKFMNYGEVTLDIPDLPFEVFEKMDGCLGIIFYHNGWRVITKGSFSSEPSVWATHRLHKLRTDMLDKSHTYCVEIISPLSKIVVDYHGYHGLVLLCAYDSLGYEMSSGDLDTLANSVGFNRPQVYQFNNVQEMLASVERMSKDQEGYVVRYSNGFRMKIKGSQYVRVHALLSKITPLAIWRSMLCCDNLDLIRMELPEEILKDFDTIVKILNAEFNRICNGVFDRMIQYKDLSNKEIALLLNKECMQHDLDYTITKFVFAARDGSFMNLVGKPSTIRRAVFDCFRPKGNVLAGYTPSSVLNRFDTETEP